MQLQYEERGKVTVVSVEGNLDALTAPDLGTALAGQIQAGNPFLVVDLKGVDYSSSAGLRVLLGALKETRRLEGDLRLAAVQDNVNKVLRLAGFTTIVRQFPDIESAIESFEETS
jgi:anti-sigma B factor antagonist